MGDETSETENNETHQMWVNLNSVTEGNLIGVLPEKLKGMFMDDRDVIDLNDTHVITLPSDFEWKTKMYFRLLEEQRKSLL